MESIPSRQPESAEAAMGSKPLDTERDSEEDSCAKKGVQEYGLNFSEYCHTGYTISTESKKTIQQEESGPSLNLSSSAYNGQLDSNGQPIARECSAQRSDPRHATSGNKLSPQQCIEVTRYNAKVQRKSILSLALFSGVTLLIAFICAFIALDIWKTGNGEKSNTVSLSDNPFVAWQGALTATSLIIKVGKAKLMENVTLSVRRDPSSLAVVEITTISSETIVEFHLTNLVPHSHYSYVLFKSSASNPSEMTLSGSFATPEIQGSPFSFSVAFASCASTGSNASVFLDILEERPLFFIHMGDLHYEDIDVANETAYEDAMLTVLSAPTQGTFYRNTPIVYMWDDHDYGANNAGADNPGRQSAWAAYRKVVPHYNLVSKGGVFQSFDVGSFVLLTMATGRVHFTITDLRSYADSQTTLGTEQRQWLEDELVKNKDAPLQIWVSTKPWIGAPNLKEDSWARYPRERHAISSFIAQHGITNLVMISGDAHMLGLDNGGRTDYSIEGGAGFPLMFAAAMDRPPSIKVCNLSEGIYPHVAYKFMVNNYVHQFGLLRVSDDGNTSSFSLSLEGYSQEKGNVNKVLEKTFYPPFVRNDTHYDDRLDQVSCPDYLVPANIAVLAVFCVVAVILFTVFLVLSIRRALQRRRGVTRKILRQSSSKNVWDGYKCGEKRSTSGGQVRSEKQKGCNCIETDVKLDPQKSPNQNKHNIYDWRRDRGSLKISRSQSPPFSADMDLLESNEGIELSERGDQKRFYASSCHLDAVDKITSTAVPNFTKAVSDLHDMRRDSAMRPVQPADCGNKDSQLVCRDSPVMEALRFVGRGMSISDRGDTPKQPQCLDKGVAVGKPIDKNGKVTKKTTERLSIGSGRSYDNDCQRDEDWFFDNNGRGSRTDSSCPSTSEAMIPKADFSSSPDGLSPFLRGRIDSAGSLTPSGEGDREGVTTPIREGLDIDPKVAKDNPTRLSLLSAMLKKRRRESLERINTHTHANARDIPSPECTSDDADSARTHRSATTSSAVISRKTIAMDRTQSTRLRSGSNHRNDGCAAERNAASPVRGRSLSRSDLSLRRFKQFSENNSGDQKGFTTAEGSSIEFMRASGSQVVEEDSLNSDGSLYIPTGVPNSGKVVRQIVIAKDCSSGSTRSSSNE